MNDTYDKIKFINNLLSNLQKDQNFETSLLQVSDEMKFSNKLKSKLLNDDYCEGVDSLISELNKIINERMKKGKPKNFSKLRINEKIRFFIFYRIKIINNLFDKKILLNFMLKQKSLIKLNKMLFKISDEIWYSSGDSSTDFNYYTKRFTLMNIYASSFLFNLKDNSNEFSKTKKFIENQINYVLRFGRFKSKIKNLFYSKTI